MRKQTFRDQGTYEHQDSDFEQIKDPVSMTIPDDSYSIQEILDRFVAGIPTDYREGYYSDTDDFDDIDIFTSQDYDLTDIDRIREQVENTLSPKSDKDLKDEAKQSVEDQSDTDKKVIDDLAEPKP